MDFTTWRASVSRGFTTLLAVGSLLTTACATESAVSVPRLPTNSPVAQFKPLAFTADVDLRTGKVIIAAPNATTKNSPTLSTGGAESPNLSLLGGEAVRLVPSNYTASAVGAFAPNKIRVTFDVSIENKLPGVKFITPTWPVPPAAGVILFPLDYTVTTTPGGVTGNDGNVVIVEQPSYGNIVPSIDWNGTRAAGSGAPFNFFNDADCSAAASNDCFRWEAFDLEILPLTGSARQTVGFDIDASVAQFRTRMIVAADLAPAAAVAPGTITGTVSSPVRGPLAGVTVTASSGQTAVTAANGTYTLADVNAGSRTVSLSNLPANCTNAPAQTVSVTSGGSTTVDFTNITCTGLPGTINGTISSNVATTVLTGITVTASNAGSPLSGAAAANGAYSIANVAAGTGTLTVGNLPAGCTAPSPAYTLTSAGTSTVNIAITCPVPVAPGYQYNTTWTNIAGGRVQLDIRVDMRIFDDPTITNVTCAGVATGCDPLTGAEFTVAFDASKLTFNQTETDAVSLPAPRLGAGNGTLNAAVPGQITILIGTTTATITGNVAVARLVFDRAAGGTQGATVGTTTTLTNFTSRSGGATVFITSNVRNTESTYVLPAPLP